nr:MAG TPA: Radical SAM superfamily [Caudoviricetes sp.]
MTNNIIQYCPWIDCNVGCDFCFVHGQPDVDKVKSLQYILSLLKLPEAREADGFGLIGGEFFQNQLSSPSVKELFYELVDRILDMTVERNLPTFWIATSLIFKMDKELLPLLEHIRERQLLDRILLCTSWDSIYRFKSRRAEKLWECNVLRLHELYPELRIHVETVLTEHFMNLYLEGGYDKWEFEDRLGVRVDYLEPNTGFQGIKNFVDRVPNFLAKRATFLRFVREVVSTWPAQDKMDFLNPHIRSNVVYNIEDGEHHRIGDRHIIPIAQQPTNHRIKYGYSDSDRTMEDDYKLLRDSI